MVTFHQYKSCKRYVILCVWYLSLQFQVYAKKENKQLDSTSKYFQFLISHSSKSTEKINLLIEYGIRITWLDKDSAQQLLYNAIALSKKESYSYGIVKGYFTLATLYSFIGENSKALFLFDSVLKLNQLYPIITANTYNNIAAIYLSEDKYEEAIKSYYMALNSIEKKWPTDYKATLLVWVRINNNLGALFDRLGDSQKGSYYIYRSAKIARIIQNKELLASSLHNIATYLMREGKLASAEKNCLEAYYLAEITNEIEIKHATLELLGNISLKGNDTSKAIGYYRRALKISNHIFLWGDMEIYHSLGMLYFLKGNKILAYQYFTKALLLAERQNARKMIMEIYNYLSSLYLQKKDYKQCAKYAILYKNLSDSLLNVERNKTVYLLETKYRTSEKDKNIALNNLLIVKQQANIANKNIWIYSIGCTLLFSIVFFISYYIYKQKLYVEKINSLKKEEKIHNLLAMTNGEEKERKRIARELHDGIGGLLSTVKLYFIKIKKQRPILNNDVDYNEAIQLLEETLIEVRKTAHNLMPEFLLHYGLPEAIRLYCNNIHNSKKIKIDFQYYGFIDRFNNNFELFTYRIIQELIQNIIKHSNATYALIQLSLHHDILNITVEDNGVGIKKNDINGIGLYSIKSRVEELNGHVFVKSFENKGTSINIEFDLQNQEIFTL